MNLGKGGRAHNFTMIQGVCHRVANFAHNFSKTGTKCIWNEERSE